MKVNWEKYKPPMNMMTFLAKQKEKDGDNFDEEDLEEENFQDEELYNFWVAHTDFNLTNGILESIQYIEGVETLESISRYRFRVGIGNLFDEEEVKELIEKKMLKFVNPLQFLVNELKEKSVYWAVAKESNQYVGLQAKNPEYLAILCDGRNIVQSWEKE